MQEEIIETGLEIAVIGMAGRFPGAKNTREFWSNLKNGVESISFLNEEELAGINPELRKNPNFTKTKGGVLGNFDYFDAFFFNYTPSEAELMAPSMRLFHECAWEALEDSGYDPGHYRGAIGLYVGIQSTGDWEAFSRSSSLGKEIGAFTTAGLSNRDFMSTMIAYKLNLKGPSFSVNTACSTSLVAIHLACQGLLSGDCHMALAGGVAVRFPRPSGYLYEEGMIYSPDGHTRAFDDAAGGTTSGDGIGAVVLKQLEDAVTDGDHIYAVIKGSAINNDGNRKVGYTAPSVEGQAEVIRKTYKVAEINPEDIGYIEAHGTATPLGDVTEVEALKIAFNTNKKHFCRLGSVKTNLGHLDIAAGIAGFIKTVLMLKNRQLPPTLHFQKPNPAIDFENSPFYINTTLETWENNGKPLRAGVSSFGIGGTNAHVVLEEYTKGALFKKTAPFTPTKISYYLILLSAKTEPALDKMTENLGRYLKENPGANLADVAYTLQTGRKHFPFRRKLVGASIQDTIAKLSSPDSRNAPSYQAMADEKGRNVIFMFPGLGPQYVNMGLDLYQTESIFQEEMDHCFEILKPLGFDIKKIIYSDKSDLSDIHRFDNAQLAIFIFEYALAKLIMSWGIKPHAMIGYSFGEYAAACISGVFNPEDILRLLVSRGKLISELLPGMMLSVPLPVKEVKPLLQDELATAIDNGSSCVVSGPAAVVKVFEKEIRKKKIVCMPLDAVHAIHSPMMDPILEKFTEEAAKISLNPPQIPYISTVTGNWIKIEDAVSPRYWARQLRETVCFAQGILNLRKEPGTVFLEVGPGRDIGALVSREIEIGDRQQNPQNPVVHLVRQPKKEIPDDYYLLDKIGLLWLLGVNIDWKAYYAHEKRHRLPLPTYPFEQHRFWRLPEQQKTGTTAKQDLKQDRELADCFYTPSWKQTVSSLALPPDNPGNKRNNHYRLVFLDTDNDKYQGRFAQNLVNRLKQKGCHVITAAVGGTFSHQSLGEGEGEEHHYIMDPTRKEDYEVLIHDICARGMEKFPGLIIHLWTLGTGDVAQTGKSYFQHQQDVGYYSILYLAQALVKHQVARCLGDMDDNSLSLRIEIVSDYLYAVSGEEETHAEKAPITGLCKTIPQEYPNISCRSIDIQVPAAATAGSLKESRLIDRIITEFTNPVQDLTVAYRGNSRWVQCYEPFRIDPRAGDPVRLRRNGVYLITGGLGNDSYIRARYLAETFRARLVLTGRTPLPDRDYWSQYLMLNGDQNSVSIKIKRIQELETLGAEVLALGADVSDELDMRLVMQQVEQHFGVLNGVIHAAGITDIGSSRLVMELGREESEWHFQPKVYGLYVLEKILEGRDLDFCLLTSSVASIIGGIGLSAYTAASIFMDAFALQKNNNGSTVPWIGLNWVGSRPGETVEVFKRVMSVDGVEQLVFSQADLHQLIRERIELKSVGGKARQGMGCGEETVSVHERPALSTPYTAPRNADEQKLADIWQRFFGIDKIGVTDDIFDLGGDSLKAINILAIVQKELNFSIPLKKFFDNPTIEGAAKYISESEESLFTDIKKAEKKDFYELSFNQKRLWFIHQMNPASSAYNSPGRIILSHHVEDEWIERTLARLAHRHESLRTAFKIIDDRPVQRLIKEAPIPLKKIDISMMASEKKQRKQEEIFNEMAKAPFDLTEAPLFRAVLLKLDQQVNEFMFNMYHIITDGWSMEIIIRDFNLIYEGFRAGKTVELESIPFQYMDFVEWNNDRLQNPLHKAGSHSFWKTKLENGIPEFKLPGDFTNGQESIEGAGYHCILEKDITEKIRRLAESHNTTLFTVMFSIYILLLSRLSGEEEVALSIIGAGREHASLHSIVGFFVNSIIYSTQVDFITPFDNFLERVKGDTLELFQHQNYPLELVFEELGMRYPEISVTFNMLSMQESFAAYELEPIENAHVENSAEVKFDLEPYITEYKNGLQIYWSYKKNMFRPETIAYIAGEYIRLMDYFSMNPGESYIDYRKSNAAGKTISERKVLPLTPGLETLPQVFEHQVNKTPDRIVIKVRDALFTYDELNRYAGRVACLIEKKLKLKRLPGNPVDNHLGNERVGLLFEHGYDMIAAIIGTLKAGKVYVPLSASYPVKRLSYMLFDSGSSLLLTNTKNMPLAATLSEENHIEVGDVDELNRNSGGVLMEIPIITGDSPAYILYTSGSTGNPKGVVQNHENVLYYTRNWGRVFSISCEDKMTLFSSFCHDGSVQDMFGALLNGATLYPYDMKNREESAPDLSEFLSKEKITIWHSVPSLFGYFLNNVAGQGAFSGLRFILLGGEPLRAHEVVMAGKYFPHTILVNIYGQTESSVSSIWPIHPGNSERFSKVIIGEPLDNTGILLVDEEQNIVGPLEIGEIVAVCPHLALGYWKNEEATQKVFSDHPVYGKMYRTGDMGRLLIDGNIEFIGRKDNQVKIRGFRIELGEIESCLLKHESIAEAVVNVVETGDESGDKYLGAYIVCNNLVGLGKSNEELSSELKEYLAGLLPDYMIPAYFIRLERLPLTPGGKVDRKALPLPGIGEINRTTFVAPRTWVEIKLQEIWRDVLKSPGAIGIEDDFFQLGGHSLRATALESRIQKALNVNVPLTEIFKRPTIRGLSKYIDAAKKERYASIEAVEKKEYYALSPAQKRLYILHRMESNSVNYNMPQVIPFPELIDVERMQSVFKELIRRHESLRTSFAMVEAEPVQRIHDEVKFETKVFGSPETFFQKGFWPPEAIIKDFIRPFDLAKAPLLRAGIIKEENGNHILLVDMHHIITDGTSNRILADEFNLIYSGISVALPRLRLQYKDYAHWQNSEVQRALIKEKEAYWLCMFSEEVPVLNLLTDYPRPGIQSFEGSRVEFILSGKESGVLKVLAKETGVTLYISILSVYTVLLSRLSGQEDIVVGTPVAARRHADLEKIIGMFVNTLALRNNVPAEASYREFVKELKNRTIKAFENQEYQFESLVEKINVARDIGRNPIFDVMFNLLNMEDYTDNSSVFDEESSERYIHREGVSKFDLTLTAVDFGERVHLSFEYCTRLFKPAAIERFISYFKKIVEELSENIDQNLSEIEIITQDERDRILYEFNNTAAAYPANKTIHQLLAEQVERTPDHVALIGAALSTRLAGYVGPVSLSYRQLNEQSARLAGLLTEKGTLADTIVGIMMGRSVEVVIGIFGILKAGGAYLPIDPETPRERIDYMLRDSGATILLTDYEKKKMANCQLLMGSPQVPFHHSSFIVHHSNHLAYVIYTSGSTGNPKGVMIEHMAVHNFIEGMIHRIDFRQGKRMLALTTISFDIFGLEVLLPLCGGLGVVVADDDDQRDIRLLKQLILKSGVDMLQATPTRMQMLIANEGKNSCLKNLKEIMVGGEALPVKLNEDLLQLTTAKIYNMYGPTETTIWSTVKKSTGTEGITIGNPIVNTQVYILNKYSKVQPIGIPGEMYIGGHGVARGYLNRPELTAERFNRFYRSYQTYILYKTGDLARWLSNGNIEFLGRIDHQVKIKGFRIELEEIEKNLRFHENVKDAVVIAEGEGLNQYLCAYIISSGELSISGLREYLSRKLPGYMIPSIFIQVEKIPLNLSGKIDWKALRNYEGRRLESGFIFVEPSTDIERTLAELWKKVLNLEKVGIYDNFFELGGNSLKVVQLNDRLNEVLKIEIPAAAMFRYLTIHSFTKYLNEIGNPSEVEAKKAERLETLNQSAKTYKDTVKRFRKGEKK